MTWHQWQAAYPMEISTGTSRRRASANASADQGHQSTGLSACCSRYGEADPASRLPMTPTLPRAEAPAPLLDPLADAAIVVNAVVVLVVSWLAHRFLDAPSI